MVLTFSWRHGPATLVNNSWLVRSRVSRNCQYNSDLSSPELHREFRIHICILSRKSSHSRRPMEETSEDMGTPSAWSTACINTSILLSVKTAFALFDQIRDDERPASHRSSWPRIIMPMFGGQLVWFVPLLARIILKSCWPSRFEEPSFW